MLESSCLVIPNDKANDDEVSREEEGSIKSNESNIWRRSTKLVQMSAWFKDYLVPSMTTILKAKVDSKIV